MAPAKENGIIYDSEILELYDETYMLKLIGNSRIKWLGHLYRLKETDIEKKMTFKKSRKKRRKKKNNQHL